MENVPSLGLSIFVRRCLLPNLVTSRVLNNSLQTPHSAALSPKLVIIPCNVETAQDEQYI